MAKNGKPADSMEYMYAAAVIGLGCFATWYFSKNYINYGLLSIAKFNLYILGSVLQLGDVGQPIIQIFAPGLTSQNLEILRDRVYRTNPNFMTWEDSLLYIEFLGQNLRPFIIAILIFSGVRVWRSQRQLSLRRKYNLDDLYKRASTYYPHLNPVIAQDLIKLNPDEGNLAREKSPIILAIEHDLVLVHDIDHLDLPIAKTMIPTFDKRRKEDAGYFFVEKNFSNRDQGIPIIHGRCKFLEKNAETYYTRQLGELYTGWQNMRLERKAVIAICGLFMQGVDSGGVAKALQLNKRINEKFTLNGTQSLKYIDDNEITSIISGFEDRPQFKRLLNTHAYELTLISGCIQEARTKGKLYNSNMYWIKHTDRLLWYAFDQEGSQMPWSESAAVRAHLLREQSVSMGLQTPHIGAAVQGLKKFLNTTEGWLAKNVEDIADA